MNTEEILEYSKIIKVEADDLLVNLDLLKILQNFGEVIITGSYSLDLMIKRDLDISLVNENMSIGKFFELGQSLNVCLNPHSMYFRSTIMKPIDNRPPNSLYWGVQTEYWKIDLWQVPKFYAEESIEYINNFKNKLTPAKREIVLTIKHTLLNNSDYGRKYSSKELYKAVLENDVKNLDEFLDFLGKAI